MCGIVGVYQIDRDRPVDRRLLVRQTETLIHRGPNDGGVFVDRGIGLGQRRLSIIDLSEGGHQPMFDAERRHVVVFNGEIYNYQELRRELEAKGHRFRTESDTETLLIGHAEWGDDFVSRLNGMFAFALYDRKTHRLFLARDRLGKKPLYYYRDADRLIFGSELKAILEDPMVPREIEPTAVADYYALAYVPAPKTIFKNIHKLPAAHVMALDGRNQLLTPYWDLDFSQPDTARSPESHAEELLELFKDAVRLRLRSDVPLGAFLSGGLDSSATVAAMAGIMERPVSTNSIGFDIQRYDETQYAREIAQRFKTDHHEKVLAAEAGFVVRQLSWLFDEPFGDSSAVPTYYLCGMTREQVTVALSGDGGDELFAGYVHYGSSLWADSLRSRVPGWARPAMGLPFQHLHQASRYSHRAATWTNFVARIAAGRERAYYDNLLNQPWRYRELLSPDFQRALGGYDPYDNVRALFGRASGADYLSQMQYVDIKTYLCDDILVKVDRASMAHALEVRCPFLDYRIVELAARIPPIERLKEGRSKLVLKKAIDKLIPSSFFDRPKMGFGIPLDDWFKSALKDPVERLLFEKTGGQSGLLRPDALRRMWFEHQRGWVRHGTPLWNAMMFELWYQRYVDNKGDPIAATPTMVDAKHLDADAPASSEGATPARPEARA